MYDHPITIIRIIRYPAEPVQSYPMQHRRAISRCRYRKFNETAEVQLDAPSTTWATWVNAIAPLAWQSISTLSRRIDISELPTSANRYTPRLRSRPRNTATVDFTYARPRLRRQVTTHEHSLTCGRKCTAHFRFRASRLRPASSARLSPSWITRVNKIHVKKSQRWCINGTCHRLGIDGWSYQHRLKLTTAKELNFSGFSQNRNR